MRFALFAGGYVLVAGLLAVVLGSAFRYHRLRRSCSEADYEAQQRAAMMASTPAAEPAVTAGA